MLETRADGTSESGVLRPFALGELVVVDLDPADSERMAQQYGDFPPGKLPQASSQAERLRVTKVATLDRRHFNPILGPRRQRDTQARHTPRTRSFCRFRRSFGVLINRSVITTASASSM
jgi:hypothetical protein